MMTEKYETDTPEPSLWINRQALEKAMNEMRFFDGGTHREHAERMKRFSEMLDELEMEEGTVTFKAEWEKLSPADSRMDETERRMFPDETYRCTRCGAKSYFGVSCARDSYCQSCGARMNNAGRRNR